MPRVTRTGAESCTGCQHFLFSVTPCDALHHWLYVCCRLRSRDDRGKTALPVSSQLIDQVGGTGSLVWPGPDRLAPMEYFSPCIDMVKMNACRSVSRSTKGASKQRRSLINMEIEHLKELLPLSEATRNHIFQLQVMALVCTYIRKHHYASCMWHSDQAETSLTSENNFPANSFEKALREFLLVFDRQGKILYISGNVNEFLGHSVEELLCHGDSIYDLIDPKDHSSVQSVLWSGPPSTSVPKPSTDDTTIICRLNFVGNYRKSLHDDKMISMRGHFIHPSDTLHSFAITSKCRFHMQPIFVAYCTPLLTPSNAELLAAANPLVFCSVHQLDMRFIEIDKIGAYHLHASSASQLVGTSWYALVHPLDIAEASFKHKMLCEEKESSALMPLRLQTFRGDFIWLHCLLTLKDQIRNSDPAKRVINAVCQIISGVEAAKLQAQGWIYDSSQWKANVQRNQSRTALMHLKTLKKTKNSQERSFTRAKTPRDVFTNELVSVNQRGPALPSAAECAHLRDSPIINDITLPNCYSIVCEPSGKSPAYEHLYF